MARYAGRGWPLENLGEPRIVLSKGEIGSLSIHHTRADVERILAIDRRSVWNLEEQARREMDQAPHRPWLTPGVVLELAFTSDDADLYDDDWEQYEMFGDDPLAEDRIEDLRAPHDSLVELALDWHTLSATDRIELEIGRPSVVFLDGARFPSTFLSSGGCGGRLEIRT